MRAALLISATLALTVATPVFAQDTYNRVVEPAPAVLDTITAPIVYDENGVMKAQHFKASDLSPEQYQALLAEADRVRTYQDYTGVEQGSISNEFVGEGEWAANYGASDVQTYETPSVAYESITYESAPLQSVEIELFEPTAPTYSYDNTPVNSSTTHVVAKGDTLYNISKRFDTTVSEIKSANGLSGTTLSIGQSIVIPSSTTTVISTQNTYIAQPTFASAPTQDGYVTRRIVEPAQPTTTAAAAMTSSIYAVLPKDTLYSISRRACVKVSDLISENGISNPNALTPGQRITLPAGHCLTN